MKKVIVNIDKSLELQKYAQTLLEIKQRIQQAQVKALTAINTELLKLYWDIGKIISQKTEENQWGAQTVEKLAEDLKNIFPGMSGFSRSNVFKMKSFYTTYEIVSRTVRQLEDMPIFSIPWGHNVVLITKVKSIEERLWYDKKIIKNGWSRTVLEWQISSDLYNREGKAITNFKKQLPSSESELVQQFVKDPYVFDFLTLHEYHVERDIEQGLMQNIQKTLLEIGKGFAFVGQQYHVAIGDKDYYIDLLFYHVPLKRYLVIELKAREFDYLDAGQISFYITAIDEKVRGKDDNPTIGLILCKEKDHYSAEYALKSSSKPIGIASYVTDLIHELPLEWKSPLPTIQEIEIELEKKEIIQELEIKAKKTVDIKTIKKSTSKMK